MQPQTLALRPPSWLRPALWPALSSVAVLACAGAEPSAAGPSRGGGVGGAEAAPDAQSGGLEEDEELPASLGGAPPVASICASDVDCEMHEVCCACPPRWRALHVDEVAAAQRRCAARGCLRCEESPADAPAVEARCVAGACVVAE